MDNPPGVDGLRRAAQPARLPVAVTLGHGPYATNMSHAPAPTVTTVIPTYRRPELLGRAVESVLAQTWPHVKVLVCDNASGDETADVVARIRRRDPRVVYHCHPENLGALRNFQFGIDAVDTEYFSLLSDDDFLLPHFYRHAMESLESHPGARFFCGQTIIYDESRGTHSVRPRPRPQPDQSWSDGLHESGTWTRLMIERFFAWTACVFCSRMRRELGPLDPILMADILYLGRAAALFPFVVRLVPCAVYIVSGQNAYAKVSAVDLRQCEAVMHQRCAELPNITESDRREIRNILERTIRIAGTDAIRAAIEAGDRTRLEEIAAYFRQRGGLSLRKRMRVALARQGGLLSVVSGFIRHSTRFSTGYKRLRRSGWRRRSLEQIVATYAGSSGGCPPDREQQTTASRGVDS